MDHLEFKIRRLLNEELIRKLLTKYFNTKGCGDLEKEIYPPSLQDICVQVPQIMGKVEIVPCVEDMDPFTGNVRIGWNLFVLGNNRMFLGESNHKSMTELKVKAFGPMVNEQVKTSGIVSPKNIIEFVIKILGSSKNGFVDIYANDAVIPNLSNVGNSGQFYAGSQGFECNRISM